MLAALGSPLASTYAEGCPGARPHGGCEIVDVAERLAVERAQALFGAEHANVQPALRLLRRAGRLRRAAAPR
ncbi:Serine hydroxymethyltransferase [Streptomyces violaceorubidus]